MTRIRYTMPVRSQGELCMRRGAAELVEEDARRRAFVYGTDSDVEALVRKRPVQRLDDFHCDLRVMRIPRFTGPAQVGTHVVLNDAPPLHAIARADEAVEADARDSNPPGRREGDSRSDGAEPAPVCVRIGPTEATSGLCDRLSDPPIEADAVVHKGIPLDCVCDLGYGIAPGTVIDEGTIPDCHVLWPGEPTTNTVWTAVEACTPASHTQDRRKER